LELHAQRLKEIGVRVEEGAKGVSIRLAVVVEGEERWSKRV
jgi:hypothetical protein